MDIEAAKQTFIQESRELLDGMESSLLQLEQNPDDEETLNALFRAVHTLKGTAGMFQYDGIVHFVHILENLLDRARDRELRLTPDLIAVLLACHDHTARLVQVSISDGEDSIDEALIRQGEMLHSQLLAFENNPPEQESASETVTETAKSQTSVEYSSSNASTSSASEENLSSCEKKAECPYWLVSIRFAPSVTQFGLDPIAFIQYLSREMRIVDIRVLTDHLPEPGLADPEQCYLGFELLLEGAKDEDMIRKAFEFAEDDCRLGILPPCSPLSMYAELIIDRPESPERLIDLWSQIGALTEPETAHVRQYLADKEEASAGSEFAVVEQVLEAKAFPNERDLPERKAPEKQRTISVSDDEKQEQPTDTTRNVESSFIRVDARKLDQLINLVGELVIASATVSDRAHRVADAGLIESASLMSRLVSEIRDTTLNVRMVPIGDTFNRYRRVVRDLSHEMGKEIRLLISGGDTELDKTIIEKLSDPLTHLIRNAIDHGIDPPDVRRQLHKPEQGTIFLNAYHETGTIVIEVRDDGSGFDRDRIMKRAVEKGIYGKDQSVTDQELFQLVFQPGFTTSEKVSDVSGRGVGMDVVKRNIESLRGTVEIDSVKNEGTTIRIRLPLTLAIIDGFFIGVGKTTWVVPLDMVIECVEFNGNMRHGGNPGQTESGPVNDDEEDFINLRGEVLPFLRLRELFGETSDETKGKKQNIVVVQYAGQRAGLLVDRLLGEYQTVIKPLGPVFQNLRGISGATILGSGEVALILDVPRLIQRAKFIETKRRGHGMSHR